MIFFLKYNFRLWFVKMYQQERVWCKEYWLMRWFTCLTIVVMNWTSGIWSTLHVLKSEPRTSHIAHLPAPGHKEMHHFQKSKKRIRYVISLIFIFFYVYIQLLSIYIFFVYEKTKYLSFKTVYLLVSHFLKYIMNYCSKKWIAC